MAGISEMDFAFAEARKRKAEAEAAGPPSSFKTLGTNMARGSAMLAGMPSDITQAAINAAPPTDDSRIGRMERKDQLEYRDTVEPVELRGGYKDITGLMEKAGLPSPEEVTDRGWLATVGQFLGGGFINPASLGRTLFKKGVEGGIRKTAKQAAGDVATGTTSATGFVVGEEYGGPAAGMVGAIAGPAGMSAAASIASAELGALRAVYSPQYRATTALLDSVDDTRNLSKLEGKTADEFHTTAELTDDPGLRNLQKDRSGESSVLRNKQKEQIDTLGERLEGEAPLGSTQDASRTLRTSLEADRAQLNEGMSNAIRDAQEKLGDLSGKSKIEINTQLIESTEEVFNAARDKQTALYNAEELIGVTVAPKGKNSMNSLRKTADDLLKSDEAIGAPKAIPTEYIKRLDTFGPEPTLQVVQAYRSSLLTAQRAARRGDNANPQLAKNLGILAESARLVLNNVNAGGAAHKAARDFSNLFHNTFGNKSALSQVLGGTSGKPIVTSQAGQVLTKNKEAAQNVDEAAKNFQGEAVQQSAKDYSLEVFRSKAMPNGVYNEKAAQRWIQQTEDSGLFEAWPDLRVQAEEIMASQGKVGAAESATKAFNAKADVVALEKFLGVENVQKAWKRTMASDNPVAQIEAMQARLAGNEAAQRGFRQIAWDDISTKPFDRPQDVLKYMDNPQNTRALETALGKEHFDVMRGVFDDMDKIVNQKTQATHLPSHTQMLGGAISIPQMLGRYYNIKRGVVSRAFVMTEFGSRIINKVIQTATEKQTLEALDQLLVNPELAFKMTQRVTKANEIDMAKSLLEAMGRTAMPVLEQEVENVQALQAKPNQEVQPALQ